MPVRYAPSPTGILHVGNLRTAWISHRLARALALPWMVRFEDIDGPRVVPGAIEQQLADLAALGLVPDRQEIQTRNVNRHRTLFEAAVKGGAVYPCTCSRQEIQNEIERMASAPNGVRESVVEAIYHGNCREPSRREKARHPTIAWRFKNPEDESGRRDFLIGRTNAAGDEFSPGYHWACAIDDHDADCAWIVRASDLAHAAPFQRLVHSWVAAHSRSGRSYPAVYHTSLVTDDSGHRLEKRTRGVTLAELSAAGWTVESLLRAFEESWSEPGARGFNPGEIRSEIRPQIRLTDLGLVTG